jgi:hypothetical protein
MRRHGRHRGTRVPGKHVAEKRASRLWWDEDGSFGAALVVASGLGLGIVSALGMGLQR